MAFIPSTKKNLGLFGVFALATGATLSSGFFLLPSFATQIAGPAVVLAYLIAGLLLIPPMLSKIELGTAMPRSGGEYYFLDRSLGPMVGTIGGLGIWLALLLKISFALVGMSAYIQLFLPDSTSDSVYTFIALGLVVFFGGLNLLGAKKTTTFQIILVASLLSLLGWFLTAGSLEIKPINFSGFFDSGSQNILSAAGLVFISYIGVTKVISVAGEIKDPERNLPLGLFLAIGTAITVYIVGLFIMVGVVGTDSLSIKNGEINLTPVSTVAAAITGSRTGAYIMGVAAIIAFLSVANAGILSASRYPLAMSRDHLLPKTLRKVDGNGTPVVGIILSASLIIAVILFLDPLKIAKLASAFQLLIFSILCLSVIVMRETKLNSYDPGFRAPFYPWLQLVGASACITFIFMMGWLPVFFSSGIVVVGTVWYFAYARKRVERYGAIYHIFERLGRKRFGALDTELREILKEKGLRAHDPFDEIVAKATVVDASHGNTFEDIVLKASAELASLLPTTAEALSQGFLHGTRVGATPVTGGVALPHLRLPNLEQSMMVIARSKDGVTIDVGDAFGGHHEEQSIHAIFFLVSPEDDPSRHLRLLAQLAGHVDKEGFMELWLKSKTNQDMKEILLRENRFMSLHLDIGTVAESIIDLQLSQLNIPDNCLVALIHRRGYMVVPRGSTVLEKGDKLTIIGEEQGIQELKSQYYNSK
ncbi:MAG: amino acid permease [Phycisphaerales bacterium]|nr:amino acid permease [Planctomycetota bacterium]MBL6997796.1 amino acid permease [Phycisphaerales bacterium]